MEYHNKGVNILSVNMFTIHCYCVVNIDCLLRCFIVVGIMEVGMGVNYDQSIIICLLGKSIVNVVSVKIFCNSFIISGINASICSIGR